VPKRGESGLIRNDLELIRNDLERQRRRALSPVENRYLEGLKRATDKPLADDQGKQALDKDPLSFVSPLKQAGIITSITKSQQ
jgi:hypothetical protein